MVIIAPINQATPTYVTDIFISAAFLAERVA
jgi:hypothetical protein